MAVGTFSARPEERPLRRVVRILIGTAGLVAGIGVSLGKARWTGTDPARRDLKGEQIRRHLVERLDRRVIEYPYTSEFFGEQHANSLTSARHIVPILMELIAPQSVVDVGCGIGTWLSVFAEHNIVESRGEGGKQDW